MLPDGTTVKNIDTWLQSMSYTTAGGTQQNVRAAHIIMMARGKEALAELEDVEMAEAVISMARDSVHQHPLLGHNICIHYSYKKQLTRKPAPSADDVVPSQLSRVLLILIKNPTHKVPTDEIFWTCSQFGKVERISHVDHKTQDSQIMVGCDTSVKVTLAAEQVLVQFADLAVAMKVVDYLNGRNVTFTCEAGVSVGSCALTISHARVTALTFRQESSQRRSYTLLNDELSRAFATQSAPAFANLRTTCRIRDVIWGISWNGGQLNPPPLTAEQALLLSQANKEDTAGAVVKLSGLPQNTEGSNVKRTVTPGMIFKVMSCYGDVVAVKFCFRSPGCCLIQFKESADTALDNLSSLSLFGKRCNVVKSHHRNATNWSSSEMKTLMYTSDDDSHLFHNTIPQHVGARPPSKFVAFYNTPASVVSDTLKLLIGSHVSQHNTWEPSLIVSVTKSPTTDADWIFEFKTVDTAFMVVGSINGARILGVPGPGDTFTLHCKFSSPASHLQTQQQQQQPQVAQPTQSLVQGSPLFFQPTTVTTAGSVTPMQQQQYHAGTTVPYFSPAGAVYSPVVSTPGLPQGLPVGQVQGGLVQQQQQPIVHQQPPPPAYSATANGYVINGYGETPIIAPFPGHGDKTQAIMIQNQLQGLKMPAGQQLPRAGLHQQMQQFVPTLPAAQAHELEDDISRSSDELGNNGASRGGAKRRGGKGGSRGRQQLPQQVPGIRGASH